MAIDITTYASQLNNIFKNTPLVLASDLKAQLNGEEMKNGWGALISVLISKGVIIKTDKFETTNRNKDYYYQFGKQSIEYDRILIDQDNNIHYCLEKDLSNTLKELFSKNMKSKIRVFKEDGVGRTAEINIIGG